MIINLIAKAVKLDIGVQILICVLVILILAGLSVFLYFSVKKERQNYKESKLMAGSINKQNFDDMLIRRFKLANVKTRFTVFNITIINAKELKETFGETQYNTTVYTLNSRIIGVFTSGLKLSNYNYDTIMLLIDADLSKQQTEDYAKILIKECTTAVKLAGNLFLECDVNIGIVSYDAYNRSYTEMWQNLELALIAARRSGVNEFKSHSSELNNSQSDEYKYYQEIKDAIEHNEFTIYYQTMVEFATNKVVAVESLLRWNHKELGVLSPNKFLNILEQSGDINWVGAWAYEQAIIQREAWKTKLNRDDLIITINLSTKQLTNPKLFDEFRQISRKYKIEPDKICFEIMEFELFEKMSIVRTNIEQLSKAGYLIAIDNYGIELNTLAMLDQIKVNIIKLERSFITESQDNSLSSGIIGMLMTYAKERNIRIIAEGIEDDAVLNYVKSFGINYGQGYYFSKPRPAKDCESDLTKQEPKALPKTDAVETAKPVENDGKKPNEPQAPKAKPVENDAKKSKEPEIPTTPTEKPIKK